MCHQEKVNVDYKIDLHPLGTWSPCNFLPPQKKFAEVMSSQLSVCPQGGPRSLSRGVSVQGGLCPGGLCPGGSLSRGISVQGGLFPGGLCPAGWSLSRGVVSVRETSCTVTSGRYASYWNAFLLLIYSARSLVCLFCYYISADEAGRLLCVWLTT